MKVSPARPVSRGRVWLTLAVLLLMLLAPLLVNVQAPSPTRIMEVLSFFTSQETWLNLQDDPGAWTMPTWNGRPRVQKPPLLVWLNLLVWHGLEPSVTSVDTLVTRSRLLAVGFALLAVAGAYWAGMTLGGLRTATLSGLMTGSGLFFIRQARYASYDTHLTGWTTLAVAAGLWAMRAEGRASLRLIGGWALCGLALTAANYTKGPVGFALVVPPLVVALVAFREGRSRNAAGLLLVSLASAACLAPWFAAVARRTPEAGRLVAQEYMYIFEIARNPLFYLSIIGLVFPWTLWLLVSLAAPFVDRQTKADRAYWVAWGWLIALLIVLTLSPVKNKRYIVPALPAAGVLTACGWGVLMRMAREGGQHRRLTIVRRIHWGVLLAASVALPVLVALQDRLLAAGLMRRPAVTGVSALAALLTGAVLLAVSVMGARDHAHGRLFRAAVLTALWMVVAATLGYYGYALNPKEQWPHRAEVEAFARYAEGLPVYHMSRFEPPDHEAMPSHEMLVYYRGVIPEADFDRVAAMVEQGDPFLLMTRLTPEDEARAQALGLRFARTLNDGRQPEWRVYRSSP